MRNRTLITVIALTAVLFGECGKNKPTEPDNAPPSMVSIPGGTFSMGSTNGNSDEQPVHNVTVSSFYMDRTEVTQVDYSSLMGVNPSNNTGDSLRPVENMTWFDAVLYCNARSKRDTLDTVYSYTTRAIDTVYGKCDSLINLAIDISKNGYRLPTEAEWEYACRAGTTTEYYWGGSYPPTTTADTLALDNNAVWSQNSTTTARVGTKLPNAWGLYDMIGNVNEQCNDWYGNYGSDAMTDPTGAMSGSYRVLRGGSRNYILIYLRSAAREVYNVPGARYPYNGFRCVRR